jgi:tetratricopeptide (TPR) repeat protein
VESDRSPADLLRDGAEATLEAAFRTGDYRDAIAMLSEARDRAVALGDRAVEAGVLDQLGWLVHFQSLDIGRERADADGEEALFKHALEIWCDIGDSAGVGRSLFGIGLVHQVLRRDWETAIPFFRESLALATEHGDEITLSEAHRHVGFYYLVEDVQIERALHHLRRSLDLRHQHGDGRWLPGGSLALGQAELVAGNRAEAVGHLKAAVEQAREAGLRADRIEQCEEWLRRAEAGDVPTFR